MPASQFPILFSDVQMEQRGATMHGRARARDPNVQCTTYAGTQAMTGCLCSISFQLNIPFAICFRKWITLTDSAYASNPYDTISSPFLILTLLHCRHGMLLGYLQLPRQARRCFHLVGTGVHVREMQTSYRSRRPLRHSGAAAFSCGVQRNPLAFISGSHSGML